MPKPKGGGGHTLTERFMSVHNTKVADAAEALNAGWRPDPTGRYEWRYWDGGWTNRVASSRPASPQPAAPPPAPPVVQSPQPAPQAQAAAPAPVVAQAEAYAHVQAAPALSDGSSTPPWVSAADAAPISVAWDEPGAESEATTTKPLPKERTPKQRTMVVRTVGAVSGFFRSFVDEPESYHSDRSIDIEHDPRGDHMIAARPANYGRAGLVALAACGVATGSYLPWLSGTIDGISFEQTGFEDGHGWAFTIGAVALVCAALLAVRVRMVRWVAMAIAVALVGLTFRDLVHAHDVVTTMNASATIAADVGTGLWIMAGCSVVALVASFRLGERE